MNIGEGVIIFNISNPLTLLLIALSAGLLLFLAKELKKRAIAMIPLGLFFLILVMHVIEISTLSDKYAYLFKTLYKCIIIDVFSILLTLFAIFWIDKIIHDKRKWENILK